MVSRLRMMLLVGVFGLSMLGSQRAYATWRILYQNLETFTSQSDVSVSFQAPPGAVVVDAAGSAWTIASTFVMDGRVIDVRPCSSETLCYAQGSSCSHVEGDHQSAEDSFSGANAGWILVRSYSHVSSPCSDVKANANVTAFVCPTSVRIDASGSGNPAFRRLKSLTQYEVLNPHDWVCCEYETEASGFATHRALGGAELSLVYAANAPCYSNATVAFDLNSTLSWEHVERFDPPAFDPVSVPSVRFVSMTVDWESPGGQADSVTYQGVFAERFNGAMLPAIRLGQFADPVFEPTLLPDGEVVDFRTLLVSVPPPPGGFCSIGMSSLTDAFTEFDGDLNADGLLCLDDLLVMTGLVNDLVQINDPRYTPRADFDLNGVIDASDMQVFQGLYALLPDCNGNGNPDECDIASGDSEDVNENGVPDECDFGACCFDRGGCGVMTRDDCESICGHFHFETDTCEGLAICGFARRVSACCLSTGGCFMYTECECEAYGGTHYDGLDCDDVKCNSFLPGNGS